MEEEERTKNGKHWRRRRRHRWARRKRPSRHSPTLLLILSLVANIALWALPPVGAGIGCFVCASVNGSNGECEDTFNSTILTSIHGSTGLYQQPCWAFRKNRKGLFPADHCVKVSGHRTGNRNHTVLIRTCALDSGSLTADTEIVRISHCGYFKYEGYHYIGCVLSCDTDGCNLSKRSVFDPTLFYLSMIIIILSGLNIHRR